jgi:Uma2 family endonuclease
MEITVDDILKSPGAVKLYQQIQEALADETRRREEFREWLTEDVKAEFINGEIVLHSPVKRGYLRAGRRLAKLLDTYVVSNDLGETSTEKP